MKKNRRFKRSLKKELKELENKNSQLIHTCKHLEQKYDELEYSLKRPKVKFWLEPSYNEHTVFLRAEIKNELWHLQGQHVLPKDFERGLLKDALYDLGKSMAIRMAEYFDYEDITGIKTSCVQNYYEEYPEFFSKIYI